MASVYAQVTHSVGKFWDMKVKKQCYFKRKNKSITQARSGQYQVQGNTLYFKYGIAIWVKKNVVSIL
jgi:hypothetical protein